MQAAPPENNPLAGKLPAYLRVLTAVLIVMFPVGLFIMFTEFGRQFLWTTTIFLGLQAVITFIVLIKLAESTGVVITTLVVFVSSFIIEWWGVNTGFPFGGYSYSSVLLPLINGVPLAISFAWFVVSVNSYLAARCFLGSSGAAAITVSSVLILATDILLEPFASFINGYWVWTSGAIPLQNFISWFVIGIIYSLAIFFFVKWKAPEIKTSSLEKIPLLILLINILNFSIINIAHGYFVLTALGLIIILLMISVSINLSRKTKLAGNS